MQLTDVVGAFMSDDVRKKVLLGAMYCAVHKIMANCIAAGQPCGTWDQVLRKVNRSVCIKANNDVVFYQVLAQTNIKSCTTCSRRHDISLIGLDPEDSTAETWRKIYETGDYSNVQVVRRERGTPELAQNFVKTTGQAASVAEPVVTPGTATALADQPTATSYAEGSRASIPSPNADDEEVLSNFTAFFLRLSYFCSRCYSYTEVRCNCRWRLGSMVKLTIRSCLQTVMMKQTMGN